MENSILFKNIHFLRPGHPCHNQVCDLLVVDNKIIDWGNGLDNPTGGKIWEGNVEEEDVYLSPGWMDLFSTICDPGYEWKESLKGWASAAEAGGFTRAQAFPYTHPTLDSGNALQAFSQSSAKLPLWIHWAPALFLNTQEVQLTEAFDLSRFGVTHFMGSLHQKISTHNLRLALEYINPLKGKAWLRPMDVEFLQLGQIHEGTISLKTGLTGIPEISETLVIQKYIALSELTGTPIHLLGISTAKGITLLNQARQNGIPVTASASILNLIWSEESLENYDAHLKVIPPLRPKEDVVALQEAVRKQEILIHSGHFPCTVEEKNVEFPKAEFGSATLRCAAQLTWSCLMDSGKITIDQWVNLMSDQPRAELGLNPITLEKNSSAELTLFKVHKKPIPIECSPGPGEAKNYPQTLPNSSLQILFTLKGSS